MKNFSLNDRLKVLGLGMAISLGLTGAGMAQTMTSVPLTPKAPTKLTSTKTSNVPVGGTLNAGTTATHSVPIVIPEPPRDTTLIDMAKAKQYLLMLDLAIKETNKKALLLEAEAKKKSAENKLRQLGSPMTNLVDDGYSSAKKEPQGIKPKAPAKAYLGDSTSPPPGVGGKEKTTKPASPATVANTGKTVMAIIGIGDKREAKIFDRGQVLTVRAGDMLDARTKVLDITASQVVIGYLNSTGRASRQESIGVYSRNMDGSGSL